jgi:hypothetical protein
LLYFFSREVKTDKEDDDVDAFLNGYVSEPSTNEIEQSLERYWTSLNERGEVNMNYNSASNLAGDGGPFAIKGAYPTERPPGYRHDYPAVVLPRLVFDPPKTNNTPTPETIGTNPMFKRQYVNEF